MSKEERQNLLDLQAGINRALSDTEDQLILYSVNADDAEYQALINKAIYYRDLLVIIHEKLDVKKL
ncbi:hypothetical protein [Fibrella aquatilis]|uniref:Uncharacterized protein n=1 Tax=Fibrella aquatilis TaxID=2817059 RepID=A0A939G9S7_9BACT|nr:hypothetical protein [Fibrella aquatilis]MBO0932676.1 hypothetical protein [Fibrella aquatilis]